PTRLSLRPLTPPASLISDIAVLAPESAGASVDWYAPVRSPIRATLMSPPDEPDEPGAPDEPPEAVEDLDELQAVTSTATPATQTAARTALRRTVSAVLNFGVLMDDPPGRT